jgi:hypothetical protein
MSNTINTLSSYISICLYWSSSHCPIISTVLPFYLFLISFTMVWASTTIFLYSIWFIGSNFSSENESTLCPPHSLPTWCTSTSFTSCSMCYKVNRLMIASLVGLLLTGNGVTPSWSSCSNTSLPKNLSSFGSQQDSNLMHQHSNVSFLLGEWSWIENPTTS